MRGAAVTAGPAFLVSCLPKGHAAIAVQAAGMSRCCDELSVAFALWPLIVDRRPDCDDGARPQCSTSTDSSVEDHILHLGSSGENLALTYAEQMMDSSLYHSIVTRMQACPEADG